jgi:hypothetical protein
LTYGRVVAGQGDVVHRFDQAAFAAEGLVDGLLRDACGLRHRADGQARVPVPEQALPAGVQDLRPAPPGLLLAAGTVVGTTGRVSYPLRAAVPAAAFVAYHRRYSRQILPVVIVPGFISFVACLALPLVRPAAVPLRVASLIAAGGLFALLATVGAAVPSHLLLQRDGFAERPYRRLRAADRIRTTACGGSAVLLVWCVALAFAAR